MEKKGRFTIERISGPVKKTSIKKKSKKPRKKDNESLRIKVLKGNAREEQKKTAIEKVLTIEQRIEKLNLDIISLDDIRLKKKKEILSLNKELSRMTVKYSNLFDRN
jgi:hypothetical protein